MAPDEATGAKLKTSRGTEIATKKPLGELNLEPINRR